MLYKTSEKKDKKPFYKQWWFIVIIVFIALGTVGNLLDGEETTESEKVETTAPVEAVAEEKPVETSVEEPSIDTSVFQYAKDVEITDAIDITQHVTAKITISEDVPQGGAVQHILNQSYDFIQQEDLNGAKTITIFVIQNNKKIFQYTVQKDKFVPNDSIPMTQLVLEASKIETMSEDVKEFGEATEFW